MNREDANTEFWNAYLAHPIFAQPWGIWGDETSDDWWLMYCMGGEL